MRCCRYRKHSVRIRRGQRHHTTVEPEGVQPRVTTTTPSPAHTRQHAYQPFNFLRERERARRRAGTVFVLASGARRHAAVRPLGGRPPCRVCSPSWPSATAFCDVDYPRVNRRFLAAVHAERANSRPRPANRGRCRQRERRERRPRASRHPRRPTIILVSRRPVGSSASRV